jgi:hypothetical protein
MIDNLKINKISKTHIQVYSQINQFKLKENNKIHRLIMIFKKHSHKVNSKISNFRITKFISSRTIRIKINKIIN